MTRTLDPNALVSLPRMDANQTAVLAQQLEAAALDEHGNPHVVSDVIKDALADVSTDRGALQAELGAEPDENLVRAIDKREDNAIAAIILILLGWSRVGGQHPLGDLAVEVGGYLGVADGLNFINIRPRDEYGIVDTKLKTIVRENLEGKITTLGLMPLLTHLREVHEEYGAVLGMTQPIPAEERAVVRARYNTLQDSIRHYVGAVLGSVQRKKPETKVLADALLRPLIEWRSNPVTKKAVEEAPAEPGKTPV